MTELFRSAFGYLSGGKGGERGSEYLGQTLDLGGGSRIKVKRVIAEGGYGFVFEVQDVKTGQDYALKRQVIPNEQAKIVKQEIHFLKTLSGHPHIVEFIAACTVPPTPATRGSTEFLIQTELITEDLINVLSSQSLSPRQVLWVFYETCQAVGHMHSQSPPIIHRDIKVENLLLTRGGCIKLCDFGSATNKHLYPDQTWSAVQRGLVEEEVNRNTTPMYRSPEMIDLYSNSPITEKADIWALGCLLFQLCYRTHPFDDSSKLRILNANYHIPETDHAYSAFQPIIRACLVVDPRKRPTIDGMVAQLYAVADKFGENLEKSPSEPLHPRSGSSSPMPARAHNGSAQSHSSTPPADHSTSSAAAAQAHKMFGFMKGGAENLFRNIKDTSNKVIQSVQSHRSRGSCDISYITSRLLVMSFPHEDGRHGNMLEEVRLFLDERHPSQYLVFNLSGEEYDSGRLHGQVADYQWPHKSLPTLESMVDLCRNLDSWLRADKENVLVIHCMDGLHPTVVAVSTYLLFLGAVSSPSAAINLYAARRVGSKIDIAASEKRYLTYVSDLVGPRAYKPHPHSFSIRMLRMSTVPLYNMHKTGCKPFVEVFVNGERVFTSASRDTMDKIRSFTTEDNQVSIPLDTVVQGNVLVVVHHIRTVPVAKSAGMGMSAVKMLQFQFHSGFISPQSTSFTFDREQLDGSAARRLEKFPAPFRVILDLSCQPTDASSVDPSWVNLPHPQTTPITCFSTMEEQTDVQTQYGHVSEETVRERDVPQAQGYGQLFDAQSDPATADILGGGDEGEQDSTQRPGGGGLDLFSSGYVQYGGQDDSDDSSSSSSSSSGESSDSEGGTFDPFTRRKEERGTAGAAAGDSFGFFSNPHGGRQSVEEENLLNLSLEEAIESQPPPPSQAPSQPPPSQPAQTTFDPFGDWGTTSTTTSASVSATSGSAGTTSVSAGATFANFSIFDLDPTPSSSSAAPPTSTNSSFDPFSSASSGDLHDLMAPTPLLPSAEPSAPQTSMPRSPSGGSNLLAGFNPGAQPMGRAASWNNISSPTNWGGGATNTQMPRKGSEPFGDLGDLTGLYNAKPSQASKPPQTTAQQQAKPTSSSTSSSNSKLSHSQSATTNSSKPSYNLYGSHTASASAMNNSRSPSPRGAQPQPSVVGSRAERGTRPKFGPVPQFKKTDFGDLLDPNLFTSNTAQEPTSLKGMKHHGDLGKVLDPERAKVAMWADGKEHNIRALISSLHTILWDGEKKWKEIGMHQLLESDQVKRYYRKACLSVHPDKVPERHENLARAIFDELNDAYQLFEESGARSLY